MSVDKVLELAKTIVTIQMTLPQSKQTINKTMLMKRHQRIAPLFADEFWGTRVFWGASLCFGHTETACSPYFGK